MEGRGAEERRSQPAIDPRIAAACLALLGPLAFTPAAIVDSAWVGPQMLGAGLGSDPLFALFGFAIFAGAVLPLLCLAVALPAWRGERYAQRLGVALALLIAASAPVGQTCRRSGDRRASARQPDRASSAIPAATPPENIRAMIRVAREWSKE